MRFIKLEEVIFIHQLMIKIGGGRQGIRDFASLHAAVQRPKAGISGRYFYKTIWQMAAALLQSLVKNHPFVDANKRTAYFSSLWFLRKNGWVVEAAEDEVVEFVILSEVEDWQVEEIAEWLKNHSRKK